MDFWQRYRAIDARDTRFDGQFYTAVRTTGIYCRPSCPARTPKAANVTFYETSAAAHDAVEQGTVGKVLVRVSEA